MIREQWRQQPARRMREEEHCEEQQEKPPRKKRRGAYEGEKNWGIWELGEDKIDRKSWLTSTKANENKEQTGLQLKQTKIRAWTMTELMSRGIILETLEESWKAIEERVELQQEEEVQGAMAGKEHEGVGGKVTEINDQKETQAVRKKLFLNDDIRKMLKNQKKKAAARLEKNRSRREEELNLIAALVTTEDQEM